MAGSSTDIVSSLSKFKLGEKVSQSTSGAFGFITEVNPTHNRITVNSIDGSFTTGTVSGEDKSCTITSIQEERDAVNHYTDSNGFKTTVSTGNTVITNEQHELNLNEEKFTIRYIEPRYIPKVVSEFIELVRD